MQKIEQNGITFDYDFFYSFSFSSSFFLGGREEKRKKKNESRGQKSCLSARSMLKPYIFFIIFFQNCFHISGQVYFCWLFTKVLKVHKNPKVSIYYLTRFIQLYSKLYKRPIIFLFFFKQTQLKIPVTIQTRTTQIQKNPMF